MCEIVSFFVCSELQEKKSFCKPIDLQVFFCDGVQFPNDQRKCWPEEDTLEVIHSIFMDGVGDWLGGAGAFGCWRFIQIDSALGFSPA